MMNGLLPFHILAFDIGLWAVHAAKLFLGLFLSLFFLAETTITTPKDTQNLYLKEILQ